MNRSIYAHINKLNGKVYIGQTINVKNRWRSRYKQQSYFHKAIIKYGWEGFDHVILLDGIGSKQELDNSEKLWIILLKTTDSFCGYNLVPGGFEGSPELARLGGLASNKKEENRNRLKNLSTFEICSSGGLKGGQVNVESGQIVNLGIKQGNINKENGHWDRVRQLGFKHSSANGKRQGKINVDNGHLKNLDQGKKNAVKLGYMAALGKQGGKKGGPAACHLRWHVRRNTVNLSCLLCVSKKFLGDL